MMPGSPSIYPRFAPAPRGRHIAARLAFVVLASASVSCYAADPLSQCILQKFRAALGRSVAQTQRLFSDPEFYRFLVAHPGFAKSMITKWYGDHFARAWIPPNAKDGNKAWILLADPGIADRVGEFTRFSQAYLSKNRDGKPLELRNAFEKYLGDVTVYRAIWATPEQAKDIAVHGMRAPEILTLPRAELPEAMAKFSGPAEDIKGRLYQDGGGYSLSVTEHPDIGIAVVNKIIAPKDPDPKKRLYLFKIKTSELNLVRRKQQLLTKFAPDGSVVGDVWQDSGSLMVGSPTQRVYDPNDDEIEAFMFQLITPQEIIGHEEVKDGPKDFEWVLENYGPIGPAVPIRQERRKYQISTAEFSPTSGPAYAMPIARLMNRGYSWSVAERIRALHDPALFQKIVSSPKVDAYRAIRSEIPAYDPKEPRDPRQPQRDLRVDSNPFRAVVAATNVSGKSLKGGDPEKAYTLVIHYQLPETFQRSASKSKTGPKLFDWALIPDETPYIKEVGFLPAQTAKSNSNPSPKQLASQIQWFPFDQVWSNGTLHLPDRLK